MLYRLLADLVVLVHLGFVVFAVLGGLLALRRPAWTWAHLPAAIWGVSLELGSWVCPLTPLEKWLRRRAGGAGYPGGFVEHYLLPLLYPPGLSRGVQLALAAVVVVVNALVYALVVRRWRRGSG